MWLLPRPSGRQRTRVGRPRPVPPRAMPSLRRNAAMTHPPLIPIADYPRPAPTADYGEPGPARELREAWLARRRLLVTLTDRCAVPMIVGRVACVSVTGA